MPSDGADECVSVLHTDDEGAAEEGRLKRGGLRWVAKEGGRHAAQHFIFMLIDSTLTAYKLTVVRVPQPRERKRWAEWG